jgi:RHS repeat-associated protein
LTYDPNGNLTNNGSGQTYQWDAENRLVSITQASGATGFVYDGMGHRVQETLNGAVVRQWVWCGSQPCEERDASGNVTKRFYAQGEQIAGTGYFYTRDHLGSVREMTDATGAVRARYEYDPYGRVTKLSGDLDADFGFTGDYFHRASGLSLTLYRAYDPNQGRWLSRDPIGFAGGINVYSYVHNNPIGRRDRLGLDDYDPENDIEGLAEAAGEAPEQVDPDADPDALPTITKGRSLIEQLEDHARYYLVLHGTLWEEADGSVGMRSSLPQKKRILAR